MIDTHCHLFMEPLGLDPGGAMDRARAAGVQQLIIPSFDRNSWAPTAHLAADHPGAHAAYGIHPWPDLEPQELDGLAGLLRGAVAVGEVGLDFAVARTAEARAAQLERFDKQARLAASHGLPLILHCRKAADELLRVLQEAAPGHPGVVHGFSRGPELARRFLDRGLHLGFGCMVVRPGAHRARRAATFAPQDRLLLETDAPAMGLPGVAQSAVEPAHVALVADTLSQLRGEPVDEIIQRTTHNAAKLFDLG